MLNVGCVYYCFLSVVQKQLFGYVADGVRMEGWGLEGMGVRMKVTGK